MIVDPVIFVNKPVFPVTVAPETLVVKTPEAPLYVTKLAVVPVAVVPVNVPKLPVVALIVVPVMVTPEI